MPVTMGFAPDTLPAPLRQFNGVTDDEAGFKSLIISIAEAAKSPANVDEVFEVWWPVLQPKLAALPDPANETAPPAPPSTDDVLSEVLGIVQGLQNDVAGIRYEGRYADPVAMLDIAYLARLMTADPGLQDRVASGDLRVIWSALSRARSENSSWTRISAQDEKVQRKRAAAQRFIDEVSARDGAQVREDAGEEDDAVFLGETIN